MNDHTAIPADNAAAPDLALPTAAVLAAVAAPLLLAGCGGGGDEGPAPDTSPTLSITAIEVRGTADTSDPITVNTNLQPVAGGVAFPLNGAVGGVNMPTDPGRSAGVRDYDFTVHVSNGTTGNQDRVLTVTINPSPAMILPVVGSVAFNKARHLAARTGFGASWDDLMKLLGMTHDAAVDLMVDRTVDPPLQAAPGSLENTTIEEWIRLRTIKEWWLREMITAPNPFTERLTLFWSNHFVVNIGDIESPRLGWNWLKFLRDHCAGNFRTFVHEMAKMPAMVIYLNSDTNTKTAPNENFARELMELFLLGEGQVYSEEDVIQVARAFTGYDVDSSKNWRYTQSDHDTGIGEPPPPLGTAPLPGGTGIKIMGVLLTNAVPADPPLPGTLAGDEAIDVILEAGKVGGVPRAARFVAEKLWAEFIGAPPPAPTSGNPPSAERNAWLARIDYYAGVLYAGGGPNKWELKPLLKAFFKNADFTAPSNIGTMLKAPMELIAGFFRSLNLTPNRWDWKVYDCGSEEQDPLAPPNVRGWLGSTAWINAKTLLERTGHMNGYQWEVNNTTPLFIRDGHEDFLLAKKSDRRFAAPAIPSWENDGVPSWETDHRAQLVRLIRALIQDPAYQMK